MYLSITYTMYCYMRHSSTWQLITIVCVHCVNKNCNFMSLTPRLLLTTSVSLCLKYRIPVIIRKYKPFVF